MSVVKLTDGATRGAPPADPEPPVAAEEPPPPQAVRSDMETAQAAIDMGAFLFIIMIRRSRDVSMVLLKVMEAS